MFEAQNTCTRSFSTYCFSFELFISHESVPASFLCAISWISGLEVVDLIALLHAALDVLQKFTCALMYNVRLNLDTYSDSSILHSMKCGRCHAVIIPIISQQSSECHISPN